ncbi:type 2 lanthipeptide synthetase LanM [Streptococcus suis]|uniref:type 2 lanthipeptide synthetase LanM n=1 Tax=Streptococcus suis TaxID=1307 RepID=UPI00375788CB
MTDELFELMLKEEGYTYEEFAYSLQEDIEPVENPEWYNKFLLIIENYDYNNINYDAGINVLTLPFSKYSLDHIKDEKRELTNFRVDEEIFNKLILQQSEELFNLIGKTMALKLAEYKSVSDAQKTNGIFEKFLKELFYSKDSFLQFFEEYPVVARMLTIRTQFFIENICDFFYNVNKDIDELKNMFNLSEILITDLELSVGDSHEHGKSVIIFEANHSQKIVYKPKNLSIEEKLSKLLEWFSSEDLLDLHLPKGLYKDDYTYNEFVDKKPCTSIEEVQNFYTRFGYLIALCYLLGIDDLHLENVVASGEYPVIIDIETAFHLSPKIIPDNIFNNILQELEHDSIKGSCLLPRKIPVGMNGAVELSALLGRGGETGSTVSTPININSDDFRYSEKNVYFSAGNNIPIFNGEEVDSKDFRFKIVEGFEDFFDFVLKYKMELIEKINQFKDTKVRILLKGTEKYAAMLRYSSHPNYGKCMKYRERLFLNIWAYPYLDKRVVVSEVRDLLFGDIPIFYNKVGSKSLIDSQGSIYHNYFLESGLDKYKKLISVLTNREVDKQKNILLIELGLYDEYLISKKGTKCRKLQKSSINFIREAKQIANYFIDNTKKYKDMISMINLDCDGENHWGLKPMNESFYSGLSGVALFFLELYNITKESIYYDYYKGYISSAILQTRNTTFQSPFFGWLSPLYPLLLEYRYNSTIVDEDYFRFTINKLNALTMKDLSNIDSIDYISGISGVIVLLQQINLVYPYKISSKTLDLFYLALKERLARDEEIESEAGLAHGFDGVTVAISLKRELLDLNQKYLNIGYKNLPKLSNQYKWCLGLSGIIQAKLLIHRIAPSLLNVNNLYVLFEKFEQSILHVPIDDDSLCHGKVGVIITLCLIYEFTGEEKWNDIMMHQLHDLKLNSLFGFYSLPRIGDTYSLGLFDGMAGIGWMYLYLSKKCSNILMLGF